MRSSYSHSAPQFLQVEKMEQDRMSVGGFNHRIHAEDNLPDHFTPQHSPIGRTSNESPSSSGSIQDRDLIDKLSQLSGRERQSKSRKSKKIKKSVNASKMAISKARQQGRGEEPMNEEPIRLPPQDNGREVGVVQNEREVMAIAQHEEMIIEREKRQEMQVDSSEVQRSANREAFRLHFQQEGGFEQCTAKIMCQNQWRNISLSVPIKKQPYKLCQIEKILIEKLIPSENKPLRGRKPKFTQPQIFDGDQDQLKISLRATKYRLTVPSCVGEITALSKGSLDLDVRPLEIADRPQYAANTAEFDRYVEEVRADLRRRFLMNVVD